MSEADVLARIELVRGNDLAMTAEKVQRSTEYGVSMVPLRC